MTTDQINSLLPEEFHTTNDIPTDPSTHDLFFVSRTKAALAFHAALGSGVSFTYGIMGHHIIFCVLGAIVWIVVALWAF